MYSSRDRDQDSPFDGDRFLLREDSGRWAASAVGQDNSFASPQRRAKSFIDFTDPPKVVRWASLASVASDKDDPIIPPPQPPAATRPSVIFVVALITALLAIAMGSHLAGSNPQAMSSYVPILFPTPLESTTTLSPALRAAIEEVVYEKIRAHNIASRGLRDYALKANGGRVALQLTSGNRGFLASREDDPSLAIDDDVHAGRCWSFNLLPCQLGIRLPHMLYPSHVTVEHLPKSLAVDIGQAPRNMTLWEIVDGRGNSDIFERLSATDLPGYDQRTPTIARDLLWAPLASFSYNVDDDDPVQTFPVSAPIVGSGMTFGVVAIEILDNWGSDTTCLYRVRIHGSPA